jgi:Zn-dependent peptidase ImmA (M78 family)
MRRGFKSEANAVAREVRTELGLRAKDPLDPWTLATHLCIELVPLSSLAGAVPIAVRQLALRNVSPVSAITVFDGVRRLVVYNDSHSRPRQASDIAHELAHALLLHAATPTVNSGAREWNAQQEAEAAWLAGALLISDEAAMAIAYSGVCDSDAAEAHGVSEQMMSYRMQVTAARLRVERTRRRF